MKLTKTSSGVVIDVYVKPNSKQFKLTVESDELVVFCRETPVKGRVNRELLKELSKVFHTKVQILSGFGSRQKKVFLEHIGINEANEILSACEAKNSLIT